MARTRFWNTQTHTHTDRVNSVCPSDISWRGGIKKIHRKLWGRGCVGEVGDGWGRGVGA